MAGKYIYELKAWPKFTWEAAKLSTKLEQVRLKQGRLIGKMEALGFDLRSEALLQTLTEDVITTSEIEGENLDRGQVRSSIAKRLGIEIAGMTKASRNVEGIVEVMLDATQKYEKELTKDRLFGWHAALFPTGRSGIEKITVGGWRDDSDGPMQVISGSMGSPTVHFQAPAAARINSEMKQFLTWFNSDPTEDSILRTGIAHFWFVTIHPFDDGNGRIARAIADMALARSEDSPKRFYSMSSQISAERKNYYEILESTQKGGLEITKWLEWFLSCLERALQNAEVTLSQVMKKAKFWEKNIQVEFNERQRKVLKRLLDGFEGNMTSSKWASMTKCSQDTAARDIQLLLEKNILKKNPGGGRSTSYSLV